MRAPRRRLWPVVLISSALLLLAVGAVAIGQLYWSGLHGGMARMRVSIDEASRRQVVLAEQVRAAEALLRQRQAELDRREAELEARDRGERLGQQGGQPRVEGFAPAVAAGATTGSLPAIFSGIDRRRLQALLAGITQGVAMLPPPAWRMQPGPPSRARSQTLSSHRALKAQVQVADAALALGDPLLLDLAATAAQRILSNLYAIGDARAQEVARQLAELRAVLRTAERRMR